MSLALSQDWGPQELEPSHQGRLGPPRIWSLGASLPQRDRSGASRALACRRALLGDQEKLMARPPGQMGGLPFSMSIWKKGPGWRKGNTWAKEGQTSIQSNQVGLMV